jgi:hypothetical protein
MLRRSGIVSGCTWLEQEMRPLCEKFPAERPWSRGHCVKKHRKRLRSNMVSRDNWVRWENLWPPNPVISGMVLLISAECGGKGGDDPLVHGVNHPNIRDVGVESGQGHKVPVGHECPRSNQSDAGSIHNSLQPDSSPMQPVNVGDPVPSHQVDCVN